MNTNLNFNVRKSDAGRWICEFVLLDQEHQFTGADPTEAVSAALEFLKTKGDIGAVEIVRAPSNGGGSPNEATR